MIIDPGPDVDDNGFQDLYRRIEQRRVRSSEGRRKNFRRYRNNMLAWGDSISVLSQLCFAGAFP